MHAAGARSASAPPGRVARLEQGQDRQHGVAVGVEGALGELDRLRPAVALDLALVGAELDPPGEPALEERGAGRLDSRQRLRVQPAGVAVEAHAQMELRVGVAEEEPAVGGARVDELARRAPRRRP